MTRKRWQLAALVLLGLIAVVGTGCGSSTPAGAANGGDGAASGGGAERTTQAPRRAKAVKFAECMRANGVSAFPDPDASGNLTIDQVANGSALDTSSQAWQRAINACKSLEPAGFTGSKRSSQQQQAALKFAQCIRSNGVPDFPDPIPNGPLVDTNRIPSSNQPGGMTILNAAMHKCGAIYSSELGLRQ